MTLISVLRDGFAYILNNVVSAISVENARIIFDYIKLAIYFAIINIPLRFVNIPLNLLAGIVGEGSPLTIIIKIFINISYIFVIKFVVNKIRELLNDPDPIPQGFIRDILDPVLNPILNIINNVTNIDIDETILINIYYF